MTHDRSELILPVYLNQATVFDMVAMLEDGIATITRVSERDANRQASEGTIGGRFGLAEVLASLVRVELSGSAKLDDEDTSEKIKSREKVHTPGSMLYKLRNTLHQTGRAVTFDPKSPPPAGAIIEFESVLHRNSLDQAFGLLVERLDLLVTISDEGSLPKPKDKIVERKRQMEHLVGKMRSDTTLDLITDPSDAGWRFVLTLEKRYLNDLTMADLVDGHFKVIGKIINIIVDRAGRISLLRKTPFAGATDAVVEELVALFGKAEHLKYPAVEWAITGPVIHVLPIAIFA